RVRPFLSTDTAPTSLYTLSLHDALPISPALLEVVARIAQQPEGFGSTGRRFSGVLGDTLGQYAQLTGVTDVLGIVVGLGVDVGEVREQQHDGNDKHDEQRCDQRTAACPRQQIACIEFFHHLAPAWTDRTRVPM